MEYRLVREQDFRCRLHSNMVVGKLFESANYLSLQIIGVGNHLSWKIIRNGKLSRESSKWVNYARQQIIEVGELSEWVISQSRRII